MESPRDDQATRHEDRRLGSLFSLPTVPAAEFAGWRPGAPSSPKSRATSTPQPGETNDALGEAEIRFLRSVVDHPGRPSSAYPKLAGMSPRRALEIRDRLVELGYLRAHRMSTSGRGRASIVLEPLEPARRIIAEIAGQEDR